MEFFKRKVMYPYRRTSESVKEIDKRFEEYAKHIMAIRGSLPEGARAFSSLSFHDGEIKEVKHHSKKEVEIVVETGGYDILSKKMLKYAGYRFLFSGIKQAWVPYSIVGATWLYEEMHLSDKAAFDYQVLLDQDEIRIQANDVKMTVAYEWSSK